MPPELGRAAKRVASLGEDEAELFACCLFPSPDQSELWEESATSGAEAQLTRQARKTSEKRGSQASQGGAELWTTDEGVTSPATGERIGREGWVEEGQVTRKLLFTFNSKDEGYEFSAIEAMDANMEDATGAIDPKQYVPGKMLFFCHRFEVSLVNDFGEPAGTIVANNFSAGGVLGSFSSADIPPYNPCPGQECSYVDGDITCKNITRVIYEDAPPEEEKSATVMYIILGSCGAVVVVLIYSIVLMMNQRNNAQYRQQAAALAIRIRQGKAAEAAEAMAI